MQCTKIKKHNYGVICNRKHTHHDGLSFRNCSSLRVENTPSFLVNLALLGILIVALILVLILLLSHRSFLEVGVVLLWVWALPRDVSWLPTIVAGIVIVALRG
jgi:uncharacterized integral membrane protein